eukprot:CAMPEP_0204446286 /NCGR_PEP_ID=MMETSP0470-20130426/94457_1 /ASSEMBLY_ACC=CAM_ASM_000385 /TAXON_ID=2969 /ORGANISM="Oxyrrhis marina" /LENGTH=35 /DNA_ID= /DNA_START= /DNA_END= /DNA_ORIENTATION=
MLHPIPCVVLLGDPGDVMHRRATTADLDHDLLDAG